jgi:O-acetylhomoserine/O-acetylserine sulfhydrylase-like pyridoxal-dependent enzyme
MKSGVAAHSAISCLVNAGERIVLSKDSNGGTCRILKGQITVKAGVDVNDSTIKHTRREESRVRM